MENKINLIVTFKVNSYIEITIVYVHFAVGICSVVCVLIKSIRGKYSNSLSNF